MPIVDLLVELCCDLFDLSLSLLIPLKAILASSEFQCVMIKFSYIFCERNFYFWLFQTAKLNWLGIKKLPIALLGKIALLCKVKVSISLLVFNIG